MFPQVLLTLGNLLFSIETAPCRNMPVQPSVREQIFSSLLSLARVKMMHPLYWFFITQSHYFLPLFLKTSIWSGSIKWPDSQAELVGINYHSHPSLVEDGKLKNAFPNPLPLGFWMQHTFCQWDVPIWVSAGKIDSSGLGNWIPYSSVSHQLQGCKPIEAGKKGGQ